MDCVTLWWFIRFLQTKLRPATGYLVYSSSEFLKQYRTTIAQYRTNYRRWRKTIEICGAQGVNTDTVSHERFTSKYIELRKQTKVGAAGFRQLFVTIALHEECYKHNNPIAFRNDCWRDKFAAIQWGPLKTVEEFGPIKLGGAIKGTI